METEAAQWAGQYRDELLDEVIPFWERYSLDKEAGGYFSCLGRTGEIFDTDKFIWLQGRQVWMFASLFNQVEARGEWLEIAENGARFLLDHGHDGNFNFYFSVDRKGRPLEQPHSIFSNTFAAIGFGQLSRATGNPEYTDAAMRSYQRVLDRRADPVAPFGKGFPGNRDLKAFALPMILSNVVLELEPQIGAEAVESLGTEVLEAILRDFYRPELGVIVEHVTPSGGFADCFEGRLVNPGHGIEAMWFLMDLAVRLKRPDVIQKAVEITLKTLERSWDTDYGGIFYFLDCKSRPPQELEWDQKLWWVHIETLIALLKGYQLTGSTGCWKWFEKVHAYTWEHFRDAENGGEWFGYLNRRGEVLLDLKGGKWKGCFHVPRGLFQCWRTLEAIAEADQFKSPR